MAQRTILSIKWGPDFPADYVNVLYNASARQMDGEWEFVCLTDNATGMHSNIRTLPIPDIGLTADQWYTSGVWPKLALFSPDLHGLRGRALFIDLDMMVLGPLGPFFDHPGGLTCLDMGPGWRPNAPAHPPEAGTAVFAFDFGAQSQILDAFQTDPAHAMANFRNEQDFVGAHARDLAFWPSDWIPSFKRHIMRRNLRDLITPPAPPKDHPIVAFHGDPRPIDLIKPGLWGKFPQIGRGPVPWVRDYWVDNGGSL